MNIPAVNHLPGRRLILAILAIAAHPVAAAPAVIWINALAGEYKRADLSLNASPLFRQIPQGTICPWFPLPAGKSIFDVTGSSGLKLSGEWEYADNSRVIFITYGKDQAASRSLVIPSPPKPGFQVFNAVPDTILQAGDKSGPAARAGFSLAVPPDGTAQLSFEDGGSWSIALSPGENDATSSAFVLTLHQSKCEGAHDLMVSEVESKSGKSDEWPLVAGAGREPKNIAHGGFRAIYTPAPNQAPALFDPTAIDWTKVKSQIAWFNATPSNQSLAIGGMMAFRQLRAGSLAHFAPWPQGKYDCECHANPGGQIGKASFTLNDAKRVVLVSIGNSNQPPRLIPIEAAGKANDGSNPSRKKPSTLVRIMNGFPAGQLILPARYDGTKLESGSISQPVEVDTSTIAPGFPGRLLLATPAGKDMSLHPKTPNFTTQPGDWALIVFLNASNPEAPDYAWVEFTRGILLTREDFSAKTVEE